MIRAMFDPAIDLLCTRLAQLAEGKADDWPEVAAALEQVGETDAELLALVDARDAAGVAAVLAAWRSGARLFTEHDRGVLKRAMKAFRKRLKLNRLDEESSIHGAMSKGQRSTVVAVEPPDSYAPDVWAELVRQGRLLEAGRRQLELPPEP